MRLSLLFKALTDCVCTAGSALRPHLDFFGGAAAIVVVMNAVFYIAFYMIDGFFIFTIVGHEKYLLKFVGILTCSVIIISANTADYVGV